MYILADTDARIAAYTKALSENGYYQDLSLQTKTVKKAVKSTKKVTKEQPASILTVSFNYPSSTTGWLEFRTVKVSEMDDKYLQGYEEQGGKFKKYLRSKMSSFVVESYGK